MMQRNRKIVAMMMILTLLLTGLLPANSANAEAPPYSAILNLSSLEEYPDLNATFINAYDEFNILEANHGDDLNYSEYDPMYVIAGLKEYNTDDYEFLGWSFNGSEPLLVSKSPKDIGIDVLGYDDPMFYIDKGDDLTPNTKGAISAFIFSIWGSYEELKGLHLDIVPVFQKKEKDFVKYNVTIEPSEHGNVDVVSLANNAYLLKAAPTNSFEYHFVGWKKQGEEGFIGTEAELEVTLQQDTTFTPFFEKNEASILLTDDPYVITKTRLETFQFITSPGTNKTPLFEGQRVLMAIPFQVTGTGPVERDISVKIYEGEGTTGKLLVHNMIEKHHLMLQDNTKHFTVTLDPLPASGVMTVVIEMDDKSVSKTYRTEVLPAQTKSLQYLTTPATPYDISTEDTGPDILDILSFVDEETGRLDVYAAAFGGVLALNGSTFEPLKGLTFTSTDSNSMGRVIALGGTNEVLTAVAINHTDTSEYVTIYEYTVATKSWIEVDNAKFEPKERVTTALVIDANNIWTEHNHWDGEKWTEHDYKFSQFVNSRNGHYIATTSDGKAYNFRTKSNTWREIQLGSMPQVSNITASGTITFSTEDGFYTRDASGMITPAPLLNQIDSTGKYSELYYNIDHRGNQYMFENAYWYGKVRTTGAQGHAVYQFDTAKNRWNYQHVPAFYAPNEYPIGTMDYLTKKVRPTAVRKIYNLTDKASIYAGRGGAIYADFDETTITFNSNGGSDVTPLTKKINAVIEAPVPTKENEHFIGWYLDKELTKAYSFDYMPAKNIELFAKWGDKPVDLTEAKATANETIEQAYKKYNKREYDDEGWSALTKAKEDGLESIAALVGSEDEVKAAMNKVLTAMSVVPISENMTIAVSMEKFTLGQGYIIEPTLVTVPRNTQASKVITDLLVKKYGEEPLPYKMTGNVTTNFYLAHVLDDGYKGTYNIPQYILDAIEEDGSDFSLDNDEWLGEFDFFKNSGWMYAVNNVFPGVGAAGWTLENDQVMRWQYTIYGLGADLNANNEAWGTASLVKTAQKDNLTWRVAEINSLSKEEKTAFLATGDNQKYYDNAYNVLTNMESTQKDVDAALKALGGTERVGEIVEVTMPEEAQVINDAIKALPTNIKLADQATVKKIRADYEALDSNLKQWIWKDELAILEAAEQKIATLEADAKKVADQIAKLPAVADFKLSDEQALKDAQTAYAALSKEQQALIPNATLLTDLTTKLTELKQPAKDPVKQVIDLITLLPNKHILKVSDESKVKEAYAAYDALTTTQKLQVNNIATLNDLLETLAQLQQAANTKAAESVIALITALPDESALKLTNEASVQSVQKAYDALTAEQKLLVTNRAKLTTLTAKLAQLKNQQSDTEVAAKVTTLINNLPSATALTLANKINVDYVRNEYNALTTTQKALIMNLSKLIEAEAKITSLETDVKLIVNEINRLPKANQLTNQHKALVETIRAAYEKLSTTQKAAVTNYNILIEAEIKVASLSNNDKNENKPDNNTGNTEVPTNYKEAVAQSTGIQSITEKKNQLVIEAKDDAENLLVTLSNEMVQQVREGHLTAVEIKTADDVSIQVPSSVFEETLGRKSSLQIETVKSKQGRKQVLQVNAYEILSNGIERNLVLPTSYLQVTFSLADFTNNAVASLNAVAAKNENGVIVRLEDGEYKAVPHVINGDQVIIYTNSNGKFVYLNEARTFNDLKGTGALQDDIEFLASRYVVNGTSETTYSPNNAITRAEFGAMIARSLNLVPMETTVYSDVKGKWYEDDIQALYEAGITNAVGQFNPNALLTREEAAAFMYRVLDYIQKDELNTTKRLRFADSEQVASYFVEAVATLNALKIMEGHGDNRFDPKGHLTRAQMAKILRRSLEEANMM